MADIELPFVNGNLYSHASIEAKFNGNARKCGSINYNDKLEPGEVRGNAQEVLGTTAGKYSTGGDVEMMLSEWERLKDDLGDNFGLKRFLITVQYAEDGAPVVQDELENVRITGVDNANSESTDGSKVKLTLHIMRIKRNGKYLFKPIQ